MVDRHERSPLVKDVSMHYLYWVYILYLYHISALSSNANVHAPQQNTRKPSLSIRHSRIRPLLLFLPLPHLPIPPRNLLQFPPLVNRKLTLRLPNLHKSH